MLADVHCVGVGPCLTHLSLRGVIVTDDSLASESRRCCSGQLDKFNTHVRRGFIWSLEEVVILPNSKYTTQRISKASEVNSILHNTQSIMTVWEVGLSPLSFIDLLVTCKCYGCIDAVLVGQ